MSNTSATGGGLLPSSANLPLNDSTLHNVLHDWIANVTNIDNTNIRPRWQPESPNIPDVGVDWVAFGVTSKETVGTPYVAHYAASMQYPNGYDELRSHRLLRVLVSIYGPNAESNENILRSSLFIEQNQESLKAYNMALIGTGNSTTIPEFLKEQWIYRVDLPLEIKQQIILDYPVLNLLSSQATLNNEKFTEQIIN